MNTLRDEHFPPSVMMRPSTMSIERRRFGTEQKARLWRESVCARGDACVDFEACRCQASGIGRYVQSAYRSHEWEMGIPSLVEFYWVWEIISN